ncbi:MAG: tetratricopeptide repeat protein [Candidatus Marinimicrobia bacterium]|nr:tetratricopeptide repeat protein [Candidatus Neomarinimicrobiota bacterium]
MDEKKFDEAIRECEIWLRANPQDEIMYVLLGMVHLKNNNIEMMFEAFESALKINLGLTSPRFIIASYYLKRKETNKALEQYRLVLKENPEDTSAKIAIARVLEHDGKINKAIQLYKEACKGENAVEALTSLGTVYLKNKDFEKTISVALEAIKLNPKVPQAYYLLGTAYSAKRDMQKAIDYFTKFRELNSLISLRHYDLGRFYSSQFPEYE